MKVSCGHPLSGFINMDSWAADCHIQLSIWNSLSCSDSDSQYFEIATEVRYS